MLRGGIGNKRAAKAAGIAHLLQKSGEHAGMAIIVDRRHALTCAHVVDAALGRPEQSTDKPDDPVTLGFPVLSGSTLIQGKVIAWRALGKSPLDDLAVIELASDAPAEAGLAYLADISGMSLDGDRLSVFGIAPGRSTGNHVDARFMGQNTDAWIQITGLETTGPFIEGGFSGGAVWDNVHEAVVGMLVRKYRSEADRFAYMIPVADLKAFWPPLPVERRPQTPSFMRVLTVFSAVFFLLIFAHWQAERGTEAFAPVTMGGKARLLNAFWGMHIFAFFAPVVFGLFLWFARARLLHPWVERVPSFGSLSLVPRSAALRVTAITTLIAFIALPLAAQFHFIRKFQDDGHVYIYPGLFGIPQSELGACTSGSVPVCRYAEAGLMRLVTPREGFEGGFWDNAYHYGDHIAENGNTVTFFPILQPVVIYLLTALALVLAGLLLLALVSARPRVAAGTPVETGPKPRQRSKSRRPASD